MIPYEVYELRLRFTRGGDLLPWLGPAFRGLVAWNLKEQSCRHPAAVRDSRWRYCHGCPHLGGCAYGQTFEPDPPEDVEVFGGQDDSARPLVLAPHFPIPERVVRHQEMPLYLTLLGGAAVRQAAAVIETVDRVGRDAGIGPQRVTFELVSSQPVAGTAWQRQELPLSCQHLPGRVAAVRIDLTSPLFLRAAADARGRRRAVVRPEFSDLLRASLRTVGQLWRLYAQPLDADFAALKDAAASVPLVEHDYRPFEQRKWSQRTEQRFTIQGVVGYAVYADVPYALLPWLAWGGRAHVGAHRVAGAGGWQVRANL